MTTKVDDNQVHPDLAKVGEVITTSVESLTFLITDNGDGNLSISAPTYIEIIAPPEVNTFNDVDWTTSGGSWVSSTEYGWPARSASGILITHTGSAGLPGSATGLVTASGTFEDTGSFAIEFQVVTASGATFIGPPTFDMVNLTWSFTADLAGLPPLKSISWSSLLGCPPWTINRIVLG